jgi:hypothetical protein
MLSCFGLGLGLGSIQVLFYFKVDEVVETKSQNVKIENRLLRISLFFFTRMHMNLQD